MPRYFRNDLGLTCFYEHAIWFIPHFHPLFISKAVLFHMKNQTTDNTVHTQRYEKGALIAT